MTTYGWGTMPERETLMSEPTAEYRAKIATVAQLSERRETLRRTGRRVVFTNGHFELLHPGHVRYLQHARTLGDCLIVGLNGDDTTRRLKGHGRPVLDQAARAEVLAALACVDYVVVFDEETAVSLVRALEPDVYVKGGDYAPDGGKSLPEATAVRDYGGCVELVPLVAGFSTTGLIREIVARFAPQSPTP